MLLGLWFVFCQFQYGNGVAYKCYLYKKQVVSDWKPSTVLANSTILHIWQGSEYALCYYHVTCAFQSESTIYILKKARLAKWLSVRLRTIWLWVRIPFWIRLYYFITRERKTGCIKAEARWLMTFNNLEET